ncbi:hypothetical protein DVK02_15740, partial [Halobellus sp. Atlit-31R]
MTTQQLAIPPSLAVAASALPEHWQNDVAKQLAPGENVLSSVEVDLDAKLHFKKGMVVVTNRRLLARAVCNLLRNAQKYAASRILLSATRTGGGVEITVDDDGPGIPEDERDKVFEPFYRLDRSR